MRFRVPLFILAVALTVASCSRFEERSALGSRLVSAACVSGTAPWLLPDAGPASLGGTQQTPALRVVTYNLHSGLGVERALRRSRSEVVANLRGIARAIATAGPAPVDVVSLNEVDFGARRSGGLDQAAFLASELGRRTGERYTAYYGETWHRRVPGFEVRFGNAALVRHPARHVAACVYGQLGDCGVATPTGFPVLQAGGVFERFARESRGLIKLTVNFDGRPLDVLVTHLDAFVLSDREAQAAQLVRRVVDARRTTVLLGDLNAVPTALTHRRAFFAADRTHDILTSGRLADARILYASRTGAAKLTPWATFPAQRPEWPLDAVLGSLELVPTDVHTIGGAESDHRGLYVEYRWSTDAATLAEQTARHDAIRRRQLAQIMRCDVAGQSAERAAKVQWLIEGTGFLDIATAAERELLTRSMRPL